MKKQLYSRKIGIAALVGASIFIFVLLHFCRMSIGKIPELEFSGYVNQSDIVNNCNLDHVKFPPETACGVYKLKKVDSAQDQKNIRKALGLDENAKFGTVSDPMPVSSTAVLGYDTESGRWIYQTIWHMIREKMCRKNRKPSKLPMILYRICIRSKHWEIPLPSLI